MPTIPVEELIDSRSFNKKEDISSLLGKMASMDCSGEDILIKRSVGDEIITPKGKRMKESSARGKTLWEWEGKRIHLDIPG
jgi:hypothetical protein